MNLRPSVVCIAGLCIAACTSVAPSPAPAPLAHTRTFEWQNESWEVTLTRRPERDRRPGSYYHIVAGRVAVKVPSAFTDDQGLASDQRVASSVATHVSPDGRALLIQETIPSDGGPCDNYLLVRKTENGLTPIWLKIPTKPAPYYSETASVRALGDDTVWYSYFKDEKVHKIALESVETANAPSTP